MPHVASKRIRLWFRSMIGRGKTRVPWVVYEIRDVDSPLDDELDALLTARGWVSDRAEMSEVHFDQWELDPRPGVHREGRVWVMHLGRSLFVTLRSAPGRPFHISKTDFVRTLPKLELYELSPGLPRTSRVGGLLLFAADPEADEPTGKGCGAEAGQE